MTETKMTDAILSPDPSRVGPIEKKPTTTNPYKVDDIISSSWGYDQTNVDFYKVTAVKGSMIELRQLQTKTVEHTPGAMSGTTWPVEPFEFHPDFPKTLRKKPKPDGSFKLESWGRWCRPWDGKPKSCSWYA